MVFLLKVMAILRRPMTVVVAEVLRFYFYNFS